MFAALAGLGLGAGYLWWQKKQAAAPSVSTCEALCIAGARAAGVTGDLSAICKQTCNLSGLASGVKQTAVSLGTGIAGAIGIKDDRPGACANCCPPGSKPKFAISRGFELNNTTSSRYATGFQIRDWSAGGAAETQQFGQVCMSDATGEAIGTIVNGAFRPYAPPYAPPAPTTKVPMPSSSGGSSLSLSGLIGAAPSAGGGVTVTQRPGGR